QQAAGNALAIAVKGDIKGNSGGMTISTLTDAHAMLILMICMAIFCFAFLMGTIEKQRTISCTRTISDKGVHHAKNPQ
ncbi:MAG: hypothetical protein N2F24_02725, partial [Deltaproteobacteria bacterium]